jgi:hypothetical protein
MKKMRKNMIINSLEKMESIVKDNSHLRWDGVAVVALVEEDGYYTKNGVFDDGEWKTEYRFEMVDYNVWNIPDRYLAHVQV